VLIPIQEFQTAFSDDSCMRCGKPKDLWLRPSGYMNAGQLYCCKGCATGFECICQTVHKVTSSSYVGPERRGRIKCRSWKHERRAMFLRNPN